MMKLNVGLTLMLFLTCIHMSLAGPVEVSKSSDDDMKTSETFGYGYYQPGLYSQPLATVDAYQNSALSPVATYPIAAPLASSTSLLSSSSGAYSRSGYGYGSGYKYGSGYGYGGRWGVGSGGTVNEFYRRHPVYVAWG